MPTRRTSEDQVLASKHVATETLTANIRLCIHWQQLLTTSVNYVKINNSMLRMRGHVSACFFCCDVLYLQGKHNSFRHIVATG